MIESVPAWQLYGEQTPFPDLLHIERIADRAAGLLWKIKPHQHTQLFQLFFLKSGHIQLTFDAEKRQDTPPVALCIPPRSVHGFAFSPGTEGWVCSMPVDAFPELFGPQGELAALVKKSRVLPVSAELDPDFARLHQIWAGRAPLRRTELRGAATLLLCRVLGQAAAQGDGAAETGVPRRKDARIARLVPLVERHFRDTWEVTDYAEALGMSARNLSRLCKLHTGSSVQSLIQAHRMREACKLLAYTQKSAQEIGFELGYDDPAYFSRRFRSFAGLSPTEYRRRLNQ